MDAHQHSCPLAGHRRKYDVEMLPRQQSIYRHIPANINQCGGGKKEEWWWWWWWMITAFIPSPCASKSLIYICQNGWIYINQSAQIRNQSVGLQQHIYIYLDAVVCDESRLIFLLIRWMQPYEGRLWLRSEKRSVSIYPSIPIHPRIHHRPWRRRRWHAVSFIPPKQDVML